MDSEGFDVIVNTIKRQGHGGVNVSWVGDGYGWLAVILDGKIQSTVASARHKTSPIEALRMAFKGLGL